MMPSFEFSAIFLAVVSLTTVASAQKNPHYVGNRTTMVHLFEWKWNDVADECERFLGPKGYAGVQVSPINENIVVPNRPWYERYQPISYKWSTRSGTEREFRSMVRRCNRAGVRIYVDAVLNHMTAGQENARGTAGSRAYGKEYPAVPYTSESFHNKCDINYGLAWTVRDCELVGLHDLDQSRHEVQDRIVAFLDRAVDAGVAGFRIDAAKHMWPDHLRQIYARVKNLNTDHGFEPNSRPFVFQEVIDYGNEIVSKYEYNQFAAVLEFKHAKELCAGIRGQNPLKWFKTWGPHWGLLPSEDAVTFVDNHDTQRSDDPPLTHKEFRMYKMAVAFMLAHPYGHPRVMSSFHFSAFDQGPPADQSGNLISPAILGDGTCGNGWVCEHRWRQIFNMVGFRNHVVGTELTNWWDNGNGQVAFCRGNRGFIAINTQHADLRQRLRTCLPAGIYCDLITGDLVDGRCSGLSLRVDERGWADVEILTSFHDGVVAYHTAAKAA